MFGYSHNKNLLVDEIFSISDDDITIIILLMMIIIIFILFEERMRMIYGNLPSASDSMMIIYDDND